MAIEFHKMNFFKNILLKLTPSKLIRFYQEPLIKSNKNLPKFARLSYAQEGEDLILERFFGNKRNGFYVDVGAHHPQRFSNTYNFYKKGWRGINIDAMPDSMSSFIIERPRDINIETGVTLEESELTYYMFNEPALNTFSEIDARKKDNLRDYKIISERKIQTKPLSSILKAHLPLDVQIDFMTIDVEGLDLEVLKSNNWELHRPTMILVEDLKKFSINELEKQSEVYKFLIDKEYQLIAKTFNTLFFQDLHHK